MHGPAQAIAEIKSGQPFVAILHDDVQKRDAALCATLGAFVDEQTRLVRVSNPLRALCTLEQLLIQISGRRDGALSGKAADEIVGALCERRDGERRVLLAIEHAEMLHGAALRFLQLLVRRAPPSGPETQVLFVGRLAFLSLLESPGFAPMRAILSGHRLPTSLASAATSPASIEPAKAIRGSVAKRRLCLQAALVSGAVAAMAVAPLQWPGLLQGETVKRGQAGSQRLPAPSAPGAAVVASPLLDMPPPSSGARAIQAMPLTAGPLAEPPAPFPPEPAPSALQAPGPVPPALTPSPASPAFGARDLTPSDARLAYLRAQFNAFLQTSGDRAARLGERQRDALFGEFLKWRSRAVAAPLAAATAAPSQDGAVAAPQAGRQLGAAP